MDNPAGFASEVPRLHLVHVAPEDLQPGERRGRFVVCREQGPTMGRVLICSDIGCCIIYQAACGEPWQFERFRGFCNQLCHGVHEHDRLLG